MPKKKISSCAEDAIFAGLKELPEDAQGIAVTYLRETFGPYLSAKGAELINRTEAIGITTAQVTKRLNDFYKAEEKFTSGGAQAATKADSIMYERDVDLSLINQHVLAPAYARITGQTRKKYKGVIGETATKDAVSRWSASEAAVRSSGIPIVISKAAIQPGPTEVV